MKISYVVPFYNSAAFIADTMESLLNQTHKDFEIICVDDGSDDDIEYIRDYYMRYGQVEWVHHAERNGAAYCRNIGNDLASGDIIAVCDAGDLYSQHRGSKIENAFSNSEVDLVYSHVQLNVGLNTPVGVQKAAEWTDQPKPPISHPTVAYKKEVTKNIRYHEGCLDTDFYEFFMIDVKRAGYKFAIIPDILCIKNDLGGSEYSRDVKNAKDEKRKKYEEYGIEIESRMV